MKVSSTAVALIATILPSSSLAQEEQCLLGGFSLEFDGRCTTETVVAAYADQVYNAAGATSSTCTSSPEADLLAKVKAAGMNTIADLCDKVYATQDKVPFTDAANRGTDLHFEKMFYNGRTDWQEEVETKYETEDGTATSILKEDAEAVRTFFQGIAQGRRVTWPGELTNFQSTVTDADSLATCTTNAAMCCWPKDRQAGDNNGNCARPYDENCVDKDVADNTDLCYVDLGRGNASTGFDSTDTLVYPGDNNEGEGNIHCHGLAWSNDVNDHTARYKANNLFFVSMYDHMYQRGYVQNIPGAPMCGCVEQMPTVSRSDCTQVDLTETVEIKFDASAPTFDAKLTQVHVDFNACQGINNRNNDLWAYMARLYYQNDITREQFGEAGRIITDNGCQEATKFHLDKKGLTPGYDYNLEVWTYAAGREAMYKIEPLSHQAFTHSLVPGNNATDSEVVGTHFGIIYRACQSCVRTHMKIFYRRKTPVPEDFNLIHNILYQGNNGEGRNIWDVDFSLHSTYEDALKDANPWECPGDAYDYGQTFYGKCSPDGTRVNHQRARFDQFNDRQDVGFYINQAEDQGIQVIPSNVIKGRDWAGGIAQKDVDGTIYLAATGRDIWWYHDDMNYLSEPADGDHTVSVHVGSIKALSYHEWSKTGIMFRTSLDSNSANFGIYLTGSNGANSNGICTQGRKNAGDHASSLGGTCTNIGATDAWLKVEKRMDTYTSFIGSQTEENGPITWTVALSYDIPGIGDSYQVGLAMSSARSSLIEAVFTSYEADNYYFPSAAPSVSSAPSVNTDNLSLEEGAVASQSSTCYGGEASRAIDGNTERYDWHGESVQHTCQETNPWWKVTLAPSNDHTIYKVIIHNRADCCQNRMKDTQVQILDGSGEVVAFETITTTSSVYSIDFDGVAGSAVRIWHPSPSSAVLNIAEVQVLGQSIPSSPPPAARKLRGQ